MKKWIIVIAGVLLFVLLFGGGYFLYIRWDKARNYVETLSGSERSRILGQVVENNPLSVIETEYGIGDKPLSFSGVARGDMSEFAELPQTIPGYQSKSYSYTRQKTELGDGAKKCSFYEDIDEGTTEYYDFSDPDDSSVYWNKTITEDKDGNLLSLYIAGSDYSLEYMGGKYAVKTLYESEEVLLGDIDIDLVEVQEVNEGTYEDSDEGSEALTEDMVTLPQEPKYEDSSDYAISYFGNDTDLEKVVEDGETKYYIATWKYEGNCGSGGSEPVLYKRYDEDSSSDTFVVKSWIDPDTFQVIKEEEYIGSEKESNLLVRTVYEIEAEDLDFDEVKDKFSFDYDVEVREIDFFGRISDNSLYLDEMRAYLEDVGSYVLVSSNLEMVRAGSQSIDRVISGVEYYYDRDFYPEGKIGDDLYGEFTRQHEDNMVSLPDMEFYYSTDYKETSVNVAAYFDGLSEDELLDIYIGDSGYEEVSGYEVVVDGKELDASIYEVELETIVEVENSADNDSSGEEDVWDSEYSIYVAIFEYKGTSYSVLVDSYGESLDVNDVLKFDSYNTGTESGLNGVMSIIKDYVYSGR
ncbi:hypothetical protein JW710_00420 [Candidatus Dojkabacteria bacterium]|nr:hypothetical protein [Candidatus Dojkabacteria bacterium]